MARPDGDWGRRDPWRLRAGDAATSSFYNRYVGRAGMFLHGGMKPGSAGCIEVSRYDEEQSALDYLDDMLRLYLSENSSIDVWVNYGQNADPYRPTYFTP